LRRGLWPLVWMPCTLRRPAPVENAASASAKARIDEAVSASAKARRAKTSVTKALDEAQTEPPAAPSALVSTLVPAAAAAAVAAAAAAYSSSPADLATVCIYAAAAAVVVAVVARVGIWADAKADAATAASKAQHGRTTEETTCVVESDPQANCPKRHGVHRVEVPLLLRQLR